MGDKEVKIKQDCRFSCIQYILQHLYVFINSELTSKIFLTLVELRNDMEAAIMALTCCWNKKKPN